MDRSGAATHRCLVVDDDEAMRELARLTLEAATAAVDVASDTATAIELIRSVEPPYRMVVSDRRLSETGELSGLDVLRAARERLAATTRVLMTAHVDRTASIEVEGTEVLLLDKIDLIRLGDIWAAAVADEPPEPATTAEPADPEALADPAQ